MVYEAVIQFKGRPVSKSFETWQDANKWVNELRYNRDKGRSAFQESVTVEKLFQAYLNLAKEKARRPATLMLAESRYKNHIKPWYKMVDMTSVTVEEHQEFLNHLHKKKKSPVLRNRIRSLLQVMYSVAIRHRFFAGAFQTNPFQSIETAQESEKLVKFWNREEMEGGSVWDLSKILGHSSTEVTEKRYGHFDLAHVIGRMKIIEKSGNVLKANFG